MAMILVVTYSSIIIPTRAISHTLHKQQNTPCMLASALEIDDVSITRGELQHSL